MSRHLQAEKWAEVWYGPEIPVPGVHALDTLLSSGKDRSCE